MSGLIKIPAHYDSLTAQQRRWVREDYVDQQNGLCSHCGHKLRGDPAKHIMEKELDMRLFPPNFLHHPIHLHHDHNTGMTIGAVHARCNGVLWQYHGE